MSVREMDELIVFEMNKEAASEIEENSAEEDANEEYIGGDEQIVLQTEEISDETGDSRVIESQGEEHEEQDVKPELKAINEHRRYLLFDELVAIVVDYDNDGTPIVEFALANNEKDDKLPLECGICPEVMHKSKLAKHLKKHKVPGTNRYACIYCDETYKDYKYLAGHARRHMGIRPYTCEPCKLYFSTKQDLRVHNQRRHHTKEHICEVCGKTFSQNTMLKRHRESTHEKKRRFQCEHCPKAYYKNFSLQEHVRAVHMGKRRMLVCPFCGMQCRDAHKMARHRKQFHLNQKQFVCEVCQEEFTDINYFDAHKRSIQCRNNTRRRLEEDNEDQSIQPFENEQLLDENEFPQVLRFQQNSEQDLNEEEGEIEELHMSTDDNTVNQIPLEDQHEGVILYELDLEGENDH